MEEIVVKYIEKPKLTEPIFVEGLPGVGNVGKLAAEHLVEKLQATKFAEIYSKFFPPQVMVGDDGVIKLVKNEFFYKRAQMKKQSNLIILTGDYQGITPDGQYELADTILKIVSSFGVKKIFTLGGYSLGRLVEKPRVFGAATDPTLVEEMKKYGVIFSKGDPSGGIVGASGLLLGLGEFYGMQSVCLMGETSGYFVDPKSAEAVLKILTEILNVKIDFTDLESKASQIEQITSKLRDLEAQPEPKKEDLGYFG